MTQLIVIGVLAILLLAIVFSTVKIVPQSRAGIVERLGRYQRTLGPGLALLVPFVDRLKPLVDLREQVVSFPPLGVITQDNVTVGIDTVVYFTVTDPRAATYEVADPLGAIEQLTATTVRNVIGGMTLEETLTSRDSINQQLGAVLDEATGRWGIRINRVELKAVDPPRSVQEAMEKQMRAERDRRAAILTAEGLKQSAILTAEGEKQSAVLKAEGARTAAILRSEGESKAIETVFASIHAGQPDERLLTYQYLQMLPRLANGQSSKVFVIPTEFSQAIGGFSQAIGNLADASPAGSPPVRPSEATRAAADAARRDAEEARQAAAEATEVAEGATEVTRAVGPGAAAPEGLPAATEPEVGTPPPPPPA